MDLKIGTIVRMHDLTVEEVISKPMFSGLTEEQANEVIINIKKMSIIIVEAHEKKQPKA